jgi:hypothetical protein
MRGWGELEQYALNLRVDGLVRIDYPQLQVWEVRYGVRFRQKQTVTRTDQLACTCGEWRRGFACWHAALICHFFGQPVPLSY